MMSEPKETTLHQRILSDIEGRIVSGEWPPGYRIPFEVELTKQYDCSRMTVNKALTQLVKAGLIERRKKSGSFVMQPQAQAAVLEIHDIKAEVQSLNLAYSYKVAKRVRRKAQAQDRQMLDLQHNSSLVEIICTHYAGTQPFCLEKRLINLQTVPEAAGEAFEETAPGPWLLSQVPWSAAEHKIFAIGVDEEEGAMLSIPASTACLVVERRTWNKSGPVTHVRFVYPGNRHALYARFTPEAVK